jgi:ferric iron reductase protein FhuF
LVSAAKEETVSQTEKFLESLENEEEIVVGDHDLEQQQEEVSFVSLITVPKCIHMMILSRD